MDAEVGGLAEDLTESILPLGTSGLIQMDDSFHADALSHLHGLRTAGSWQVA